MSNDPGITAERFVERLKAHQSRDELLKHQRYFKFVEDKQDTDDYFIGVRMGTIFEIAKEFIDMPCVLLRYSIEKLDKELRVHYLSMNEDWTNDYRQLTPMRL